MDYLNSVGFLLLWSLPPSRFPHQACGMGRGVFLWDLVSICLVSPFSCSHHNLTRLLNSCILWTFWWRGHPRLCFHLCIRRDSLKHKENTNGSSISDLRELWKGNYMETMFLGLCSEKKHISFALFLKACSFLGHLPVFLLWTFLSGLLNQ